MWGFIRRHLPLGSGALGLYPTGHRQESRPIWIGWRQGDPDAGFELLDAPGDLEGAWQMVSNVALRHSERRGAAWRSRYSSQ